MNRTRNTPVKSVVTTFDVVEALVDLDGARIGDLTEALEIPKSTVHDHVRSLVSLGYAKKDLDGYRVSTRFLEIGERARTQMSIYDVAKPEVERLASETGQHASLMVEENGRGVILYTSVGEQPVRLVTHDGTRTYLHTSAAGKAILGHLSRGQIERIIERTGLPKLTENTITDPDELFAQLEEIRERGYAINRGERLQGMQAVAAPILTHNDVVAGSVCVYGPYNRIEEERFRSEIPDMVLQTANIIEVALNYL